METQSFDDVIIGGGSAGCVLANRLSANAARRVLLIEAGRDLPPDAMPAEIVDSYPMPLFFGDKYIWPSLEGAAARTGDGHPVVRNYEQARVLGGGSSINVQSANRGLPRDYDEWREMGATGWGWDDVLPYFRKLECDLDFDGPLHGRDGPIPIRRVAEAHMPPFGRAVADAFAATGLPFKDDQNAEFEDGIYPPGFSNRGDKRASTASCYLDVRTRQRRNLMIWADTRVDGVEMNGRRAAWVRALRGGRKVRVSAHRVIVTAGALQSPAIMMRAGIGPAAHLREHGIDVSVDLPGVGANLHEHPALTFCQFLPRRLRLPRSQRRAGFVALRYSSRHPDCDASDMYVTASARAGWHGLGARLGLYFVWCNRPYSRGTVALKSSDPDIYPSIDLNLLSDGRDLERMIAAARFVAGLVVHPALNSAADDFFPASFSARIKQLSQFNNANRILASGLGLMMDSPGALRHQMIKRLLLNGRAFSATLASESMLEDFVRRSAFGVWHPSGTCRMGQAYDRSAVVDPRGKVIGTENIYVADASIMPRLPTANTNIPTIMLAEKISDMLGEER